jgi:glycosyltransferase involved in cell wall biosynthesis
MRPYLLVSGDFVRTGGMDMANFSLARYLAERGHEVHLVAHRVAEELAGLPNVRVHRSPKPLRSYLLGETFLDRMGRYWAARLESRGGRVVVNGGNCLWKASNWVHYVHAAYVPDGGGSFLPRAKAALAHRIFLSNERRALLRSSLIITNSAGTQADVTRCYPVPPERVHTVHYGIDQDRFRPATSAGRVAARAGFGWAAERPVLLFVGSLGDERKGFASLFAAWKELCANPAWDVDLAVAGAGFTLPGWKRKATEEGLASRIHFLGFHGAMPLVMAACDALVSPARYEAYGLAVQEALCSGLPAFVTASAGIAERYPKSLHDLLIQDPGDLAELCARLRDWRGRMEQYREGVSEFSRELRAHTWEQACARVVELIEAA